MNTAALASAFASTSAGQTQIAVAAAMLKMNAEAAGSIVKVLEAAQQNIQQLAAVASGIGGSLDISV